MLKLIDKVFITTKLFISDIKIKNIEMILSVLINTKIFIYNKDGLVNYPVFIEFLSFVNLY